MNTLSEWQIALNNFNKKKLKEPIFITTDMTPEDADILLEDCSHNRSSDERRVRRYHSFMQDNKWALNGECIKVSDKGNLLDGQHRLQAIRRFKKPVRMSVAIGVAESTFAVNDTGRSRSAGDILKIAGYKNYNGNASALRWLLLYENGENLLRSGNEQDHSPSDVLDAIKRWPHIPYFFAASAGFSKLCRSGFMHFFIYVTQTIDPEASYDFMQKFETGENLGKTSPILMLREELLKFKMNNLALANRHLAAYIIITWNAYREKKRPTTIRWDGKEFPTILGVDRKKLFSKNSGFGIDVPEF